MTRVLIKSTCKSINFDAFLPLVDISFKNKVKQFIYASSSSVYGIKKEQNVTEDMSLEPLTDYSKFKAECEKILIDIAVMILLLQQLDHQLSGVL